MRRYDEGSRRAADRRVVRTKKAIREAFMGLVQERDYEKITVASIAREADIDRKTFYLHYGSVDDVVDELIHEEAERLLDILRGETFFEGGRVDVADLFSKLSIGLAQNLSHTKRMAEHVSADVILKKIEVPLTDALIEDDGLGLGAMGPYLGYCVSFFIAGLLAVYRRWLLTDSEIPLEDLSAVASAATLVGVNGILQDRRLATLVATP